MHALSHVLAYVFHPLLILSYCLLLLLSVDPYAFGAALPREKLPLIVITVLYTFFLPLITTIFMSLTGLVTSVHLSKKEDRIGPLIAAIIFYTWFLMNIKDNTGIHHGLSVFALGALIGISLAFLCTVFMKVSLHCVGMGGLCGVCFMLLNGLGYQHLTAFNFQIHLFLVLLLVIALCGLVASSRLLLGAHVPKDVYSGLLIGFVSQWIAWRFLV